MLRSLTLISLSFCSTVFGFALESDRAEVQLGVSRSGLPANTRIAVNILGDGGVVLASGPAFSVRGSLRGALREYKCGSTNLWPTQT